MSLYGAAAAREKKKQADKERLTVVLGSDDFKKIPADDSSAKVKFLYAQSISLKAISRELNVAYTNVQRWVRVPGVRVGSPGRPPLLSTADKADLKKDAELADENKDPMDYKDVQEYVGFAM